MVATKRGLATITGHADVCLPGGQPCAAEQPQNVSPRPGATETLGRPAERLPGVQRIGGRRLRTQLRINTPLRP